MANSLTCSPWRGTTRKGFSILHWVPPHRLLTNITACDQISYDQISYDPKCAYEHTTTFSQPQSVALVLLCPGNLIRSMVKGEGFVRPVQAFVFLEMFPETFL